MSRAVPGQAGGAGGGAHASSRKSGAALRGAARARAVASQSSTVKIGRVRAAPVRALVVGRFQPFHTGHLRLVEQAASAYGEVIVAVASAQNNHLPRDPFTAGERIEMIRRALADEGPGDALARCIVLPVSDRPDNAAWAAHLRSALPPFGAVLTGNPYVAMLLSGAGVAVDRPEMVERKKYVGSGIREMMARGDRAWESLVPRAVAAYVNEIGGAERVCTIAASDTAPGGGVPG